MNAERLRTILEDTLNVYLQKEDAGEVESIIDDIMERAEDGGVFGESDDADDE